MAMPNAHRVPDTNPEIERVDIHFPSGLVGCPEWQRFVLLRDAEAPEVALLQCVDEPAIQFAIARVTDVEPGFFDALAPADRAALAGLGVGGDPEVELYCTVTVHPDGAMTANLLGPLVLDRRHGSGAQVVLAESPWPARHPIPMGTE